jgi:hypothetical protein
MSKEPTGEELRTVERAIALRATGHNWDKLCRLLGVELAEARGWTRTYPEFWARRLAEVHRELDEEVLGEARAVLRFHMRSDQPDGRACARVLLDHARRRLPLAAEAAEPAAPTSPFHQIAAYLEGLSDEDRQALLDAESEHGPGLEGDEGLLPPGLVPFADGGQ